MQAYTNLQQWRAKSRTAKIAAYKAVAKDKTNRVKMKRIPGFILPFDRKAGVYIECRQLAATQTGAGSDIAGILRNAIGTRIKDTILGTDTSFKGENYKFARVTLSERQTTGDLDDAVSRKTENVYHRYRSNNVLTPFGAGSAGEDYGAGETAIRNFAAVKTFLEKPGNRIIFDPQG